MGRNDTILKVKNLTKEFYKNKKLFTAVDHISFQLQKGECLGIVGESGCGKTTTIKMITQLLKADSGEIWVDGKQIAGQKQQNRKEIKNLYTKIQMVFQTPQDSFDPRRTLGEPHIIVDAVLAQVALEGRNVLGQGALPTRWSPWGT